MFTPMARNLGLTIIHPNAIVRSMNNSTHDEMVEVVKTALRALDGRTWNPVTVSECAVDALSKHFATCPDCKGRGYTLVAVCNCHGSGRSGHKSWCVGSKSVPCPSCNGSGSRLPVDRQRFTGLEAHEFRLAGHTHPGWVAVCKQAPCKQADPLPLYTLTRSEDA